MRPRAAQATTLASILRRPRRGRRPLRRPWGRHPWSGRAAPMQIAPSRRSRSPGTVSAARPAARRRARSDGTPSFSASAVPVPRGRTRSAAHSRVLRAPASRSAATIGARRPGLVSMAVPRTSGTSHAASRRGCAMRGRAAHWSPAAPRTATSSEGTIASHAASSPRCSACARAARGVSTPRASRPLPRSAGPRSPPERPHRARPDTPAGCSRRITTPPRATAWSDRPREQRRRKMLGRRRSVVARRRVGRRSTASKSRRAAAVPIPRVSGRTPRSWNAGTRSALPAFLAARWVPIGTRAAPRSSPRGHRGRYRRRS